MDQNIEQLFTHAGILEGSWDLVHPVCLLGGTLGSRREGVTRASAAAQKEGNRQWVVLLVMNRIRSDVRLLCFRLSVRRAEGSAAAKI